MGVFWLGQYPRQPDLVDLLFKLTSRQISVLTNVEADGFCVEVPSIVEKANVSVEGNLNVFVDVIYGEMLAIMQSRVVRI